MNFDTNYLVAIIAFYGAVIAFFIPFTIDMSSKLKKQFGSEVIAKRFEDEKVVKTTGRRRRYCDIYYFGAGHFYHA